MMKTTMMSDILVSGQRLPFQGLMKNPFYHPLRNYERLLHFKCQKFWPHTGTKQPWQNNNSNTFQMWNHWNNDFRKTMSWNSTSIIKCIRMFLYNTASCQQQNHNFDRNHPKFCQWIETNSLWGLCKWNPVNTC